MGFANAWTPKLGLDLRGGTTITLTAANSSGAGTVAPDSLELARTIIQQRVDSLGVGETEVTTSGDRQIMVSVPNVQADELVSMVGQTAQLNFRKVFEGGGPAPPPSPSAETVVQLRRRNRRPRPSDPCPSCRPRCPAPARPPRRPNRRRWPIGAHVGAHRLATRRTSRASSAATPSRTSSTSR
ncbi:MAG: hypothetical protein IPL43_04765 [Micropruina sp.]|nr:hypothetical protein [Micropruina sp.]